MQIVIPSYKRANNCLTAQYMPSAYIAVHESQVEEYKLHNKNPIISIPDSLQKTGMANIRNFILDATGDEDLLMMDDDIKYVGLYDNQELIKLKEWEVIGFAENAFRMARELGTKLWGVNLQSDKKFYREYSPFSLSSVILGPFMGIIKDKDIRFDKDLGLKEDYDYSLQVLNKYRKILRFNKYHYVCGHIDMKGGCATFRTMEAEKSQAERFQKKWGSNIVKIKRKTQNGNQSINPVVIVPINGI